MESYIYIYQLSIYIYIYILITIYIYLYIYTCKCIIERASIVCSHPGVEHGHVGHVHQTKIKSVWKKVQQMQRLEQLSDGASAEAGTGHVRCGMGILPWKHVLVGGLVAIFYFPIYWEQSSQLTFIFFRGVQTTNQCSSSCVKMCQHIGFHHRTRDKEATVEGGFNMI